MTPLDPARWLVASAELDRVLELAPEARAPYLAALQARDATLAADVAWLLDEHHALEAAGFLADGPGNVFTASTDSTREWSSATAAPSPPGTTSLGGYRIVRTLGRGGMGVAYEADEVESGRRVALKVLKERIHDTRERERFDREGRLAASINHPHCVFVFAAAELDGHPAIAMELMQGTLADRLKADGPLSPTDAVDAVLQLISGLQAAAALGILHRDVKPSNCFVDADGVIKIGDFGISRSLRPTEEIAFSTRTRFAATPAYASPEQLRGAVLDTRADIYSLGATLYELLTARPPFQRDDLMALLMAVANDAPQPPHAIVPAVPKGLSQVVLRCLAKKPEQRFADYDALAAALEPYSSAAASPATLGRRFFAGVVDLALVGLVTALLSIASVGLIVPLERSVLWVQQVAWFLGLLAYFGIAERVWAVTPGKALVGLTLADVNGRPLHAGRVMVRAALFAAVWTVGGVLWIVGRADFTKFDIMTSAPWIVFFLSLFPWVLPAAVFTTARRRNSYAAWHDLATGTRIVEQRALATAARITMPAATVAGSPHTVGHVGPFDVIEGEIRGLPAEWRPGHDDRLRRPVWIRMVPPGVPPLDVGRVSLSRSTRLRWLAGRREPHEAWDVFEAVPGLPLERACAHVWGWENARWWLLDLARECAAQTREDRAPIRADRVWILDNGRAKFVDDPISDGAGPAAAGTGGSCAALLLEVVGTAQRQSAGPWPLGAHRFVERLRTNPPPSPSAIVSDLEALTRHRALLTRRWRALHIMGLVALPLLLAGSALFSIVYFGSWQGRLPRDVHVVGYSLWLLQQASKGLSNKSPEDLEAIEITLASRYRHVLLDGRLSTPDYMFLGRQHREAIERVLRRNPTAEESRRAGEHAIVQALAHYGANAKFGLPPLPGTGMLVIAILVVGLGMVASLALVATLVSRGGLMRALGLEMVTADGRPASRLRAILRTLLAWAPLVVLLPPAIEPFLLGVVRTHGRAGTAIVSGLGLLVLLAGAIFTVLNPSRSIQDRLAGTWIVPR